MHRFNDAAIAKLVRILKPLRHDDKKIEAGKLCSDMEEWARLFAESRADEAHQRALRTSFKTFARMCTNASDALTQLAEHPALSGETSARLELAGTLVEGDEAPRIADVEAALRERSIKPLIQAEWPLIQAEMTLAKKRDEIGELAEYLRFMSEKALAASVAAPSVGHGRSRDDSKLNSTIELVTIFERHSLTRAVRINDTRVAYGAFTDFVTLAFKTVGERAPTARVQEALKWYATHTREPQ